MSSSKPVAAAERHAADRVRLDRLTARRGLDAVRAAAGGCGARVARSAAEAEGLALAGRRAAAVVVGDRHDDAATRAPWVEHRVAAEPPEDSRHGFILVAADVQDAVDHAVVAQRLAADTGRAGLCIVPPPIAERLAAVELPPVEAASLLPPPANGGTTSPGDGAARRAFAEVSRIVGRPVVPVRVERREGARVALVASGADAEAAIQVADVLRRREIPCATVIVSLLHPFPADVLGGELAGLDAVIVVEPGGVAGTSRLARCMARVVGEVVLHAVPAVDAASALAGAARIVGIEPGDLPTLRTSGGLIAAHPAGHWSESLLLEAVAPLAALRGLPLAEPVGLPASLSGVAVGHPATTEIDLLVAADPASLDGGREIAALRRGGTLLILGSAGALDHEQRAALAAREARVLTTDERDGRRLHGAVLGAAIASSSIAGEVADPLAALAVRSATPDDPALAMLREGSATLSEVDPAAGSAAAASSPHEPTMPEAPAEERPADETVELNDRLLAFHMTGEGLDASRGPWPSLPLRPAALAGLDRAEAGGSPFPLVLLDPADVGEDGVVARPLAALVADAVDGLSMLQGHAARLCGLVERRLRDAAPSAPLAPMFDLAWETLRRSFDLSEAGVAELDKETATLRERLPARGTLFAASAGAPRALHRELAARDRRRRRAAARDEMRRLLARLDEGLAVEAGRGQPEAGRLSSSLGSAGSGFVDAEALSRTLPEMHGPRRMAPRRRERLLAAREALAGFVRRGVPELVVVQFNGMPDLPASDGIQLLRRHDPFRTAVGLFDGLVRDLVPVARGARLARMEAAGDYEPERHDPMLDRLDGDALTADELRLLPAVVVEIGGRELRSPATLAALSELLRSGRPVQVVVEESVADALSGDTEADRAIGHADLGYLAVAHREAFVLQSTLARAEHVVSGMERMICALDPAVAVVAVPDPALPVPPRTQLAAALGGRATPCFLHDPAAGPSWADRFELAANPQPETAWPESLTFCVDDGERVERREAFTFAHAIALDPAYRAHLGVLPRDAWSDAQIEIADWLERPRGARRRVVPFIWVALDDGTLARAAVTRELAAACQDRLRSWHVVQELAGTDNAYVQRAAEAVLAQAKDDAAREIETVERTWADKLERARADGANDAMNRLVQILLDMDSVPAPSTAPSPEPPPPSYAEATEAASPPPAAAEPAAAIEEQEDEPSFDEAYVDSVLCTTCNECINLNPRLFAYHAHRQAEIADASAGTFEQLVKAAEKCPARCIHPGAPRAGDETATDEVVARAERFR